MPAYKNGTGKRITYRDMGYMEWQPGEEKRLPFFVPHEALGLTMTDKEPYTLRARPGGQGDFGYEEMMIDPGAEADGRTYKLPYWESVELSVFILEGSCVRMYIGDSGTPIVIDTANNHCGRYAWNMCAYLTFEADDAAAVGIKVEPCVFRGTEGS